MSTLATLPDPEASAPDKGSAQTAVDHWKHPHHRRRAWTIIGMLMLFQMIGIMDKFVLALAASDIMREYGLSASQYGMVVASFSVFFAASGVLTGIFVVSWLNVRWLLAILASIWAVAQLPVIFVPALWALIGSRILLGAGEGPSISSAMHTGFGWFPPERRSLPNALITDGNYLGLVLSAPLLVTIMSAFGWRAGFVACGIISLGWVVLWLLVGGSGPYARSGTDSSGALSSAQVPIRTLLTDRTLIGCFVLLFCCFWVQTLGSSFTPLFLGKGLGIPFKSIGTIQMTVALIQVAVVLSLSILSQRLIRSGRSTLARPGLIVGAFVAGSAAYAIAASNNSLGVIVTCLGLGGGLAAVALVLGPVLMADFLPPSLRGPTVMVVVSSSMVAALIAPVIAGRMIDAAGVIGPSGYRHVYWSVCAVLAIGALVGALLLRPTTSAARYPVEP